VASTASCGFMLITAAFCIIATAILACSCVIDKPPQDSAILPFCRIFNKNCYNKKEGKARFVLVTTLSSNRFPCPLIHSFKGNFTFSLVVSLYLRNHAWIFSNSTRVSSALCRLRNT
jgi:hypothetical protein